MSLKQLNKNNFDQEIKSHEGLVLLDFYADWCGPCRMVAPIVHAIAEERADLLVGKINVDDEASLADAYGIFSIPTLIVMKNGEVIAQATGAKSKEQILSLLEG